MPNNSRGQTFIQPRNALVTDDTGGDTERIGGTARGGGQRLRLAVKLEPCLG